MAVGPATTTEQDKKLDEAAQRFGKQSGMAAGIELRQYISRHTDTYACGPTSAVSLPQQVTQ